MHSLFNKIKEFFVDSPHNATPKENEELDKLNVFFSDSIDDSQNYFLDELNSSHEEFQREIDDLLLKMIVDQVNYETSNTTISEDNDINVEDDSVNENELNNERLKFLKRSATPKFLRIIREENFEFGYQSESEIFIKDLFKTNRLATLKWLNDLFIEHFNDPQIVINILRVMSRLDYKEINSIGMSIALGGLKHTNIEVRENSIRAIEQWGQKDHVGILNSIEINEDWLKEYVEAVIDELESEYVLYNSKN